MTTQQSTLRSALAELVALEDLDRALGKELDATPFPDEHHPKAMSAEWRRLLADHTRRKPLAWSAARAALQQVPEQPVVQMTTRCIHGYKAAIGCAECAQLLTRNPAPNAAQPASVSPSATFTIPAEQRQEPAAWLYTSPEGKLEACPHEWAYVPAGWKIEPLYAEQRQDLLDARRLNVRLLRAAKSALRSYQYGNSAPDLATEIIEAIDAALSVEQQDQPQTSVD